MFERLITELGDTTPYKGVGGCGGEVFIVVRPSQILQRISGIKKEPCRLLHLQQET